MKKMFLIALVAVAAAVPAVAQARPGALDASFGIDGKSIRSVSLNREKGVPMSSPALARLGGGGTVALAGNILFVLRADGSLDRRFAGGRVRIGGPAGASLDLADVAVTAEGRIVVVGSLGEDAFVARYNRDGSLDPSFGQGGILRSDLGMTPPSGHWWPNIPASEPLTKLNGVAVEPDGRIILSGTRINHVGTCRGALNYRYRDAFVARLLGSGDLDAGFGQNGVFFVPGAPEVAPPAAAPGPSAALYLMDRPIWGECDVRYQRQVTRVGPNGTFEGSLRVGGMEFGDLRSTTSMALDHRGRILVAEPEHSRTWPGAPARALVRRFAGGALDRSFGKNGVVRLRSPDGRAFLPSAIQVDRRGGIVVAGAVNASEEAAREVLVARLLASGDIDRSFGRRGMSFTGFGRRAKVGPPELILSKGGALLLGTEITRRSLPAGEGLALARYLSR